MGRRKKKQVDLEEAIADDVAKKNGHNSELTDDEKRALMLQHKRHYEVALADKKAADAALKNVCKKAKAECVGFEGSYEVSSLGRIRRVAPGAATRPGKILNCPLHKQGYRQVQLSRDGICRTVRVSRLVAAAFLPDYQDWLQVDHIDGNRSRDSVGNLRMATGAQNAKNRAVNRNSSTGIKGVSLSRKTGRYVARIQVDGRRIELGEFETATAAGAAYSAAAAEHHGRFARGNHATSAIR